MRRRKDVTTQLYGEIYVLMAVALPIMILGAYFFRRGLARSRLNKRAWFWTATALLSTGILLPVVLAVFLRLPPVGNIVLPILKWYFWSPILLGSALPFIVLSVSCFRWGHTVGRTPEPPLEETGEAEKVIARPAWFWVGLVLFVLAQAGGWAMFMEYTATRGGSETLVIAIIFGFAIPLMSIPIIRLSGRKLRHRWLWPGAALFAFGVGAIPEWLNMYLNIGRYPAGSVPHDLSDLVVSIGLAVPFILTGSFCLWKGWPRLQVRHPRVERLSFILTSVAISLMWSLVLVSTAGGLGERDILSFSDDFEDGTADGWRLHPGWRVARDGSNYVLEGQGQDYQWAWPRVTQASAYALEADFQLINGSLRLNTMYSQALGAAPNRYIVGISEGNLYLSKESVTDSIRSFASLGKFQANVVLKQWHHIKIIVGKDMVRVYLDGELKIEIWDEKSFPQGSFAIETGENSHAYVDNIVVKPTPRPVP